MAQTGTHDIQDLLNYNNTTAETYGYDRLLEVINRELTALNRVVDEQMALFATPTTQRTEGAPTGGALRMVDVDPDYGRTRTQKGRGSAARGFPLTAKEVAVGWTAMYLRLATPADMAQHVISARTAYVGALRDGLMNAFFRPTNYIAYDSVVANTDQMPIAVKALANSDGEVFPASSTGRTFDGTHNHFAYSNDLSVAAADDLVRNVTEHYEGNRIIVYISTNDESRWRALAGFAPYMPGNIVTAQNVTVAAGNLDISQTDDRPIGVLPNGAVVHTKPWIPANYAVAINTNAPRPLKRRIYPVASMQGLFLHAENVAAPLQAQSFMAFLGFGASERTAASVLYYAAGASSYVAPTFNTYRDEEGSDA